MPKTERIKETEAEARIIAAAKNGDLDDLAMLCSFLQPNTIIVVESDDGKFSSFPYEDGEEECRQS